MEDRSGGNEHRREPFGIDRADGGDRRVVWMIVYNASMNDQARARWRDERSKLKQNQKCSKKLTVFVELAAELLDRNRSVYFYVSRSIYVSSLITHCTFDVTQLHRLQARWE